MFGERVLINTYSENEVCFVGPVRQFAMNGRQKSLPQHSPENPFCCGTQELQVAYSINIIYAVCQETFGIKISMETIMEPD